MQVQFIHTFSFYLLLLILIEFSIAVNGTDKNSSSIGKLLTKQSAEGGESKRTPTIVFHGCFSVWTGQLSRLEPPGSSSHFDELNNVVSCTEKCEFKNPGQPQVAFLRGKQCLCSPQSNFASERTSPDNCNHACPGNIPPWSAVKDDITNACGGNFGYSVYCIDNCKSLPPKQRHTIIDQDVILEKSQSFSSQMSRSLVFTCAKCHRNGSPSNLCTEPVSISPSFDYFPLNKAHDCINFCKSEISYVKKWNSNDEFELGTRFPSRYAILLWWRVPESRSTIHIPICSCYDGDLDDEFLSSPGPCDQYPCPGNNQEFCGALVEDERFATVYCVQDETCVSGSSTQTTEPTEQSGTTVTEEMGCGSDFTTTEHLSTTEVNTTPFPTTAEVSPTTEQRTTEYPDFDPPPPESSSESVGISESSTKTSISTTVTPRETTVSLVTSSHTEAITDVTNVTSPFPPETPQNNTCANKCRKEDRHGNKWEGCPGHLIRKQCSRLIPGSNGMAYWYCNNQSQFSTLQPNVKGCKSRWVQEMKEKLKDVNNTAQACEFTDSLHKGCKASHERESYTKYFGQEISQLAYLINDTLCKAKSFSDISQGEFEKLVNSAVHLDACLINQHEPWIDLTIIERSFVSTELLEATEDILFHLTHVVSTDTKYSKIFQPIQQFTAAAEAFNKGSVSKEPYMFPPDKGQNRESHIKLPAGWTDLLPDNKVEIAVISIAPECVAKVMTGSGVYEVNGQNDKMLNGRLMSLTVTSSSPAGTENSLFMRINAVRSYPLKFSGEGVEISFHHVVEAWGDEIYDIPRKLHYGEKRKAVMGSAQCAFWDTKLNMWSTEGCQLVKTGHLETVCECFHLTSFAILMDVHRYVGKDAALNIITLILCPISEVGLVFAIIILTLAKNCAYKMRTTISKHLCFCLFLGNGMILVFLDRNYINMSEGVCMGAAMVAHYIFLCAFMWMFFEGVQLYRMVINVFDNGKSYMRHFGILAYGSPFIIIAITTGIAYWNGDRPYGGDAYCWLVGNYIWTFMVPVALVITVNLIILFIALKTAYQLQQQGQTQTAPVFITDKIRSYRIYFRGCFSLTIILGITWVVGFFVLMEGSGKIIAAYLFTILNASQGLFICIFTFRVHMSKVRLFTQRKLSTYFPSLLNSGSSNNSMIFKKPNVVIGDVLGKDCFS